MSNPLISPRNKLRRVLSRWFRVVYRVPVLGMQIRRLIESHFSDRSVQERSYWNESLKGWASSYLGGTFANDLRDLVTVLLAKRLAPDATSVLDLGCAGATLALSLGPNIQAYMGVDISDVAIAKAREQLSQHKLNGTTYYQFDVSTIQDFLPDRQYDIIVLNEVLYYLTLHQLSASLHRYSKVLSPGGLILVSLKDHDQCRPIRSILKQELEFVLSVVYQQKTDRPGWKIERNSETPAYLVQAYRKKQ